MVYESQREWGWPIAIEIFCGGTAGGAYILSALSYLIFGGRIFFPGVAASLILVLISLSVLMAESASVRRLPRVFSNIRSPLTVGAISLSLFVILSIATIGILHTGLAKGALSVVVWLGMMVSLLTIIYPGMLMSLMKAIPFWSGSGPSFLLLSASLVSGSAVVTLAGGLGKLNFSLSQATLWLLVIYGLFLLICIMTGGQSSKTARVSVQRMIKGNLFFVFIIGVILIGWAVPFAFCVMDMVSSSTALILIGSMLILIGGILMRYSLMAIGVRVPLLPEDTHTASCWRYR